MGNVLLLDLGLVLAAGFAGALLSRRLGQSVIIGYVFLGLLLGPYTLDLIQNPDLITMLGEVGVVLLMFFLGLEFSLKRLHSVRRSVLFIGSTELLANLAVGFLAGYLAGWPLIDRLFLAGIMAMSSSGVVAKLLFEMKRTASREAEILMGVMVFEDFIAVIYLGVLAGIIAAQAVTLDTVIWSVVKAVLFYGLFLTIGARLMGMISARLAQIDSEEQFIAALFGLLLLVAAGSLQLGVVAAAGAFLLGMIIDQQELVERLHQTLAPFRDAFLVIFFLSFGTHLNPHVFPEVALYVALFVPLSILAEVVITSTAAFISGLSPRKAVAIGAGMVARGEYAMIYATLGLTAGVISPLLYNFTGLYVLVMTLLAPFFMRHSGIIEQAISRIVPVTWKFAAKTVSAVMRPVMLPDKEEKEPVSIFTGLLLAYLGLLMIAFLNKQLWLALVLAALGAALIFAMYRLLYQRIIANFGEISPSELPMEESVCCSVVGFTLRMAALVWGTALFLATFWQLGLWFIVVSLLLFAVLVYYFSRRLYLGCVFGCRLKT
ncbi:MAG: cation:proton antiporter [Syntrophomonadaceae bacterium]|nr:cation:proton antiporter [Syntrophomonadaceae bacterium]